MCEQSGFSYAILFVDLVKAFDLVCREIILGWSSIGITAERKVQILCDNGLAREAAFHLCST